MLLTFFKEKNQLYIIVRDVSLSCFSEKIEFVIPRPPPTNNPKR